MNFTYLVESGKYKEDDLTTEQKEFLSGFDYAASLIDDVCANRFAVDEESTQLERLVSEIQINAADKIKEYMYRCRCEAIVCLCDDAAAKQEED